MVLRESELKKAAWLSFYGFMLVWSPLFGTSEATVFPWLSAFPGLLMASRVANIAAFGAVMAAVAVAGERAKALLSHGTVVAGAVALGTVGMAAGSLVGLHVLPTSALAPAGFCRGAFYGVLTVVWINTLIQLQANAAGSSISAALALYAVAGLLTWAAARICPALAAAVLSACPALSYVGCRKGLRDFPPEAPVDQENAEVPRPTRWMLYVANFLFATMLGVLLCYFALYDSAVSIMAFLAASVVLLAVYSTVPEEVTPHRIFRVFLLLFAIAVPVVALTGDGGPLSAEALASATLAVIVLYTCLVFMDTQARMRKPFWRIPGICQVFAAAGFIAGSLCFYAAYPDGAVDGAVLVLLAASCVVFVASVFSPSGNQQIRPWGFSGLAPEESPEVHALRRCGELAQECGLTSRELEILQMLAVGTSNADIAEALVISPATAKTHVRNIYSKLGVHSRADLEALLAKS